MALNTGNCIQVPRTISAVMEAEQLQKPFKSTQAPTPIPTPTAIPTSSSSHAPPVPSNSLRPDAQCFPNGAGHTLIQLRCSKQHFIATYNCVEAECGVLECRQVCAKAR